MQHREYNAEYQPTQPFITSKNLPITRNQNRKGVIVNSPGIRERAEDDQVISRGTSEGTSLVVISITVRAWARVFEEKRVDRRLTRVRRIVRFATTVYWIIKRQTRALTTNALTVTPFPTRNPQISRTRAVQVH